MRFLVGLFVLAGLGWDACHSRSVPAGWELAYIGPGAGFAFLGSFLTLLWAFLLSLVTLVTWPVRMAWKSLRRRRALRRARIKKLIFLGLDGLDPRLAEKWMNEGKLPNLARLRAEGSFHRLRTTFPPLSPVAWSTFATGVSPAKHRIFDFLDRNLRTYLPELSSSRVRKPRRYLRVGRYQLPVSRAEVEFRRKSVSFWKILADRQVDCTILRVPITFPPEKFRGRLLSGMCAPDLRGTQGSFSFYSTEHKERQSEGGTRFPLLDRGDHWEGWLPGPENPLLRTGEPLTLRFTLWRRGPAEAELKIDGRRYWLRLGQYTPWIRLRFRAAPGIQARGICRFLLRRLDEQVELYVTPLQIDPENPALPISHPSYFAAYLAKLLGPYATLGLAEDTWGLSEGAIDEAAFLEQVYSIHAEREAMFFTALERLRQGVVVCVFDASDRIQHMFFRYLDGREAGPWTAAIEQMYRRMDELVGKTLQYVDEHTVLFVLSDHGFGPFRRGVNLNSWLYQNGYLALKDGRSTSGPYFEGVDWSRTRAYSFGLAGIYLNLKGREAQGIVDPGAEAMALKQELRQRLRGLVDEELGVVAIREVYITERLYRGPYVADGPDLIIGYNEGYRASWEAATGQVTERVIEDNTKAWSGDHGVDPRLVPGVLFCNRKLEAGDPGIEDLAPTALALFGIEPPAYMDGKPLLGLTSRQPALAAVEP